MTMKKRATKSIALALIGVIVAIPTLNTVSAMEKGIDDIQNEEMDIEDDRLRGASLGLNIPGTAIAPAAFKAVGLIGYTIMNIYYASSSTAKEIDNAWDKIPSKLRDPNGSVGIGKFDQRLSKGVRKNSKTGWTIDPSTTSHKGDKWKLKDKKGNRVASLDSEGRVVGK